MAETKVKVIFGGSTGEIPRSIEIMEKPKWGHFVSLAYGGDVNGDSYDDVFASTEKIDSVLTGGVLLFLGDVEFDIFADHELAGPLVTSSFGYTVAFGGHVSNTMDKYLIIGDDQSAGWNGPGKVYIYSLGIVDEVKEKTPTDSPKGFRLYQNYLNPFNSSTEISYDLSFSSFVTLDIFSCMGQKLKTLISERQMPGSHRVVWDGKDKAGQPANSGIYFVRLLAQSVESPSKAHTEIRKIILIK